MIIVIKQRSRSWKTHFLIGRNGRSKAWKLEKLFSFQEKRHQTLKHMFMSLPDNPKRNSKHEQKTAFYTSKEPNNEKPAKPAGFFMDSVM